MICCMCGEDKCIDQFHRRRSNSEVREKRCKPCKIKLARDQRHAEPERHRAMQRTRTLKHKYGIDDDHYQILLMHQNGRCYVCGRDNPGRKDVEYFMIDHDHATGKVRGLLCQPCNVNLGWYERFRDKVDNFLR